jgi:hypothetical protein
MTREERRKFVESKPRITLEGIPCEISAWTSEEPHVTCACGGYWDVSWDDLLRVAVERGGNLMASDVTFSSFAWLGDGVDIPDALMAIIPRNCLKWGIEEDR